MARKNANNRQVWDALVMVLQFGINMLVPIFACTLLGVYIGNKTGLTWMCIPLFFVGAVAGFNNIYRTFKKFIKDNQRDNKNRWDYQVNWSGKSKGKKHD